MVALLRERRASENQFYISELWLELSELTGSETIFARARTGMGRELAITKRRLSNTTNFRFWL
jgi:hypothetical protein